MIVVLLIALSVVYLHTLSYKKAQEIYLEETGNIVLEQKKQFIRDTVNNVISEIDRQREIKLFNHKRNLNSRKLRIEEKLNMSDSEFTEDFIRIFSEESVPGVWTAILWDSSTGQVLYDSHDLFDGSISDSTENVIQDMAVYEEIEKNDIRGIYGISSAYIDDSVKKDVAEMIRSRSFSNNSYIWVNRIINYEGGENYAIREVHPNLKDTEGTYLSTETMDIRGNKPYLRELEGIKSNGEIFFNYYFKELNSDKISEKISYARLYKDFDWVIAMGMHIDDIESYTLDTNRRIENLASETFIMIFGIIVAIMLAGFMTLFFITEKYIVLKTKSLEKQMDLDVLTGVFSRRGGESFLQSSYRKFRLTGENPAVMIFDIDNFKHINDNFGHSARDKVLIKVADAVNHIIRTSDKLIRWGGDEFVGVFPGLREDSVVDFGNTLLKEVSGLTIYEGDQYIRVTISMGFSYFSESDHDYRDALKRADEALYKSKNEGRNSVNLITLK